MSHQGNVRVITEGGDIFLLTSGRWTGSEIPGAVRDSLGWSYSGDDDAPFDSAEFLQELVKNPAVSHPVAALGNADVPTVEVDFKTQLVTWMKDGEDPYLNVTFDAYIESDFDTVKATGTLAQVYQERFQ